MTMLPSVVSAELLTVSESTPLRKVVDAILAENPELAISFPNLPPGMAGKPLYLSLVADAVARFELEHTTLGVFIAMGIVAQWRTAVSTIGGEPDVPGRRDPLTKKDYRRKLAKTTADTLEDNARGIAAWRACFRDSR